MTNSIRKLGLAFMCATLLIPIAVTDSEEMRVTHASPTLLSAVTTFDPVIAQQDGDKDKDKDKNKNCLTKPCPKG